MLVAAVDTSTLVLSCALCEVAGGEVRVVAELVERAPTKPGPQGTTGGHGGRLPGALLELLAADGRKLEDVDGYAVGLGPGSFTGLRIGLATWKGLAYARRKPIAGASSLAALALAGSRGVAAGAVLVPVLDARKGEVYAGFYRVLAAGRVEGVAPEVARAPADLAREVERLAASDGSVSLLGGGIAAGGDLLMALPRVVDAPGSPPAWAVARLCAPALQGASYDASHLFALEPHYVRKSEAEVRFPHGLGPGATRP